MPQDLCPSKQAQLRALLEERKKIAEQGEGSPGTRKVPAEVKVNGVDTGDMVEKEAKRLEVQRRRQERNMEQMVNYELMRKTLQARLVGNGWRDRITMRHGTASVLGLNARLWQASRRPAQHTCRALT